VIDRLAADPTVAFNGHSNLFSVRFAPIGAKGVNLRGDRKTAYPSSLDLLLTAVLSLQSPLDFSTNHVLTRSVCFFKNITAQGRGPDDKQDLIQRVVSVPDCQRTKAESAVDAIFAA